MKTIEITVNLPMEVIDDLKSIARVNDIDFEKLVISYLEAGAKQDLPMVRRIDFFEHTKKILEKHNVPSEAVEEITDKFTY